MSLINMSSAAASAWAKPEDVLDHLDDRAWYLVKTNGMEWRDHDLHLWRGQMVRLKMEPRILRGRPVLIALVDDPKI